MSAETNYSAKTSYHLALREATETVGQLMRTRRHDRAGALAVAVHDAGSAAFADEVNDAAYADATQAIRAAIAHATREEERAPAADEVEPVLNDHPVSATRTRRSLMGRELYLIHRLAGDLHKSAGGSPPSKKVAERMRRHNIGRLYEGSAYGAFEVQIVGDDGKPTGHIARVEVTLDRFDEASTRP